MQEEDAPSDGQGQDREHTDARGSRPPSEREPLAEKKHPCADCHACQFCSDTRCRACRGDNRPARARMSIQQQIELYNRRNKGLL